MLRTESGAAVFGLNAHFVCVEANGGGVHVSDCQLGD